jgi:hypothetical protein
MEERQARWHLKSGGRRWWRSAPGTEAAWRGITDGTRDGEQHHMVRSLCELEWGKRERRGGPVPGRG